MKWSFSDIPMPLERLGVFLPWVIAFLVFLMCTVLIGAHMASQAMMTSSSPVPQATIEIPKGNDKVIPDIVKALEGYSQIKEVTVVGMDQVARLLKPWLQGSDLLKAEDLPQLIDVAFIEGSKIDFNDLESKLKDIVSGIRIESMDQMQGTVLTLVRVIKVMAYTLSFLLAVAVVVIMNLLVRASMAIHKDTIAILTLIGATPRFIAKQFENQTMLMSLKGSIVGVLITYPMIGLIAWVVQSSKVSSFVSMNKIMVASVLLIPVFIMLFSKLVTRASVSHALKHKEVLS